LFRLAAKLPDTRNKRATLHVCVTMGQLRMYSVASRVNIRDSRQAIVSTLFDILSRSLNDAISGPRDSISLHDFDLRSSLRSSGIILSCMQ